VPCTHRAASLAANMPRPGTIRLANLTHARRLHSTLTRTSHEVTWPALGKHDAHLHNNNSPFFT
jgi:hypothetical protein